MYRGELTEQTLHVNIVCVWGGLGGDYGAQEDWKECKLVFNFTKGGFWLSQSILLPLLPITTITQKQEGELTQGEGGLEKAVSVDTVTPWLMDCFSAS